MFKFLLYLCYYKILIVVFIFWKGTILTINWDGLIRSMNKAQRKRSGKVAAWWSLQQPASGVLLILKWESKKKQQLQ
jgi:hypothetical protein